MYQSSEFNNLEKEEKDRWGIVYNWISDHQSDIVLIVGIILVALISFTMGRMTSPQSNKEPVVIENQEANILDNAEQVPKSGSGQGSDILQNENNVDNQSVISEKGIIVVSKNGTKYHWQWCSFAKKIKPENQVWFKSEAEAQKAGYTACGCINKSPHAGYKSDLTK